MRVLLVDDQPVFRLAMRAVVNAVAGFEVCGEAACGEHALQVFGVLQPDLILMDVHLGGLDGFETARHSRGSSADQRSPAIVLLSTYEPADYAPLALAAGALAYVSKNELTPDLLASIWRAGARPRTVVP